MPQVPIIQHSLNGGEMSDRMAARQDQNKRQSALARSVNWVPRTVGGVVRASGSMFVQECKIIADKPIKIIRDFIAANDAAYALEFGHLYCRVYRDGIYLGVELATPYSDSDLPALDTGAQSVDVKYLFHAEYPAQKIVRLTATTFALVAVNWNPPSTTEDSPTGTALAGGTLTPSATTGTGVTFTASAGTPFLTTDIGRIIVSGAGRALITARPTSTTLTADVLDAFASTSAIAAGSWRLSLSPQTTIDVENGKKEVGDTAVLTAGAATFRSADVGKFISVFGGLAKINTLSGGAPATAVNCTIVAAMVDIDINDPAPTRAWALEGPSWSSTKGYPSCGTFYDGRLWALSGTQIDGSKSGDFENFAKGDADDSAIQKKLSDDKIDPVKWVYGMNGLVIGTGSGIFLARPPGESEPLTPSNFPPPKKISDKGAARLAPVQIGNLIHYMQYGQRRLREVQYDFATDKFKSPNLFTLSDHLTESYYLTELFYAAEPDSIVYAVRNDGTLLMLTYQEDEGVMGWARRTTQGEFKSGCAFPRPSTGKSWEWVIVERANGTFVEYFEPDKRNTGREWNQVQTDSAVFKSHDVNFVVTGLDHLEGQTVRVIGNGMLYDDAVVSGGEITLSPQVACDVVEVGLNYESDGLTLEPAVPAELGGPFMTMGYSEIGVRVRRALGLTINGERMLYRRPTHSMDEQVPLQKGRLRLNNLGYEGAAQIAFKQDLPFPAEILGFVGLLKINDKWDARLEDDGTPPLNYIGGTDPGDPDSMFTIDLVIGAPKTDYVVYSELLSAGWNGSSPVTYTLTVNNYSRGNSLAGISTGAPLPPGSVEPTWTINASVQGKGGNGSPRMSGTPTAGGDAIDIEYSVKINVTNGKILAGGGGGRGGVDADVDYNCDKGGCSNDHQNGGDGGGGAGGGLAGGPTATNGSTTLTTGAQGLGGPASGPGPGGALSTAGANGGDWGQSGGSTTLGAGGTAGFAVRTRNGAVVTWLGGHPANVVGSVGP